MSWLITGANGYIGRHVADHLCRLEKHLTLTDLHPNPKFSNLSLPCNYAALDLRDGNMLEDFFKDYSFQGVIHLAGLKSVPESFKSTENYFEANVRATETLLTLCEKYSVPRFIFASSAAVYARSHNGILDESSPLQPSSPYGSNKLAAERLFSKFPSVNSIALRLFNVTGSAHSTLTDVHGTNLIPKIISDLKTGETLSVYGGNFRTRDGTAERDFVDIIDVVKTIEILIGKERWDPEIQSLNVGSGKGYTVLEVISIIEKRISARIPLAICDRREGDIDRVIANTQRMQHYLGFSPNQDLDAMVENLIP